MKRTIIDFTGMRKGTHTQGKEVIQLCPKCQRKGSGLPLGTLITHKVSVTMLGVGAIAVAALDQCSVRP